jgi:hypothetical protein
MIREWCPKENDHEDCCLLGSSYIYVVHNTIQAAILSCIHHVCVSPGLLINPDEKRKVCV